MTVSHAAFSGSIPAVYDTCLGPLLFEFSAADMAERVSGAIDRGRVLEIACGTGIGTEFLRQALAPDVEIVIVEGLTSLEKLPPAFTFVGLPLKISGRDGSPIRAVALVEE